MLRFLQSLKSFLSIKSEYKLTNPIVRIYVGSEIMIIGDIVYEDFREILITNDNNCQNKGVIDEILKQDSFFT